MSERLYVGWDLSTTQLKGIVVRDNLKLVYEAHADFDKDFGAKYGVEHGVLTNPAEGEIYSPNAMWLEAIDLVITRLKDQGLDASKVVGISGAGMQHGTVFWGLEAASLLEGLSGDKCLVKQLENVFSHPHSPNWQDASTQEQCQLFDECLGSPAELALITGSKAHHRFSGPQILRFRQKYPDHYKKTSRISLVSSFLASVFLGKVAPIDIGDVGGMNLRHIKGGVWDEKLLQLTAGGADGVEELRKKLGPVPEDGGGSLGKISRYFVDRYGFSEDCDIAPFTGDNPSTILALPLRESDAIVSLGTSTTFLMSTPTYKPDAAYHFMNHPTTAGLYMFMLCYKNGSLARERARDALNAFHESADANSSTRKAPSWDYFNKVALSTPALDQTSSLTAPMKLGLFFPRPEIVPNLPAGSWTFHYHPSNEKLEPVDPKPAPTSAGDSESLAASETEWLSPHHTVRATLESQFLSCRLRAQPLMRQQGTLPPQPRRIYIVGGGAVNPAIAQVCGEVLGGAEGVFRLDIGGNACALGSAYKAVWALERRAGETFEELIGARWREEDFVEKVDQGYREGVWEKYGEALRGFEQMETLVLRDAAAAGAEPIKPILSTGSALSRERTGQMGE